MVYPDPRQYAEKMKRQEEAPIPPGASVRFDENGMPSVEIDPMYSDQIRRVYGRVANFDERER